jgi:hypothetical protein
VHHFYHAWALGDWQSAVWEHLWALDGFDGELTVGIVGPPDRREQVRRTFAYIYPNVQTVEADEGFEQVTLTAIAEHAASNDGAVMYAHTKGAAHPGAYQDLWRRTMTMTLIRNWREHVTKLAEVDVIGCHWITDGPLSGPFFGGNFWIASCEYLRGLAPVGLASRHDAEVWVGSGDPRVLDVLPGQPPSTVPVWQIGRLVVPL